MPPSRSPTKRRKMAGSKRASSSKAPHLKKVVRTPEWPKKELPIEIYNHICEYLPRSTIESMRLVCKEFERKVSPHLFRWVVVPFKPEIYGVVPEPSLPGSQHDGAEDGLSGALVLQDKGMAVFQGYGSSVLKFAMSFELDLLKLTYPPTKSDQEVIVSFWGVYRWPFQKYNRYPQLEGLEQTADETSTMSKALRNISKADELGLSIDAGLGWLAGPDTNPSVILREDKIKVFGRSRFMPEPEPVVPAEDNKYDLKKQSILSRRQRYLDLRNGRLGDLAADRLRRQGVSFVQQEILSETEESDPGSEIQTMSPLQSFSSDLTAGETAIARDLLGSEDSTLTDAEDNENAAVTTGTATQLDEAVKESYPLKPNDLTSGQREMLLEIEWAQRAFMHSYKIAVIDNAPTFVNIRTFTVARLPSRFVQILDKKDFWDALPALSKLSLAIIPDWREVSKLPTSYVSDVRIPPSRAVSATYNLLFKQIADRDNITTLHFEWLSGGERAPGIFARNHQLLAAPVVADVSDMVDRTKAPKVLSLPYVTNLSIKNCWFSPHVLKLFCSTFADGSLQHLAFDSVSLTAPIPRGTSPSPLPLRDERLAVNAALAANALAVVALHQAHAPAAHNPPNNVANNAGNNTANIGANFGALQMANLPQLMHQQQNLGLALPHGGILANIHGPHTVPAAADNASIAPPDDNEKWDPPLESWVSIIEVLTPSHYKSLRFREEEVGEPDFQPSQNNPSIVPTLRDLDFKSCGYAQIPLDYNQSMLEPLAARSQNAEITKRISEMEGMMMQAPNESLLGVIVNNLRRTEKWQLVNAYFFEVAWPLTSEYRALAAECVLDGIPNPGRGRFSGSISFSETKPSFTCEP